jgi:copper chaperone CopZ
MAATREFQVTGMTCAHCEQAVTHEVGQISGVEKVEVSASTGRLVVISTDAVDNEQVLAAVDEAGYTAISR